MKGILSVIFSLCIGVIISASAVTLIWSPSPDSSVTGYNVYYFDSANNTNKINVGKLLTANITNLMVGKYTFFATAYDTNSIESEPSNFVIYTETNNIITNTNKKTKPPRNLF